MAWYDEIVNFVEEKPWIAVGGAIGGAAVIALALRQRDKPVEEGDTANGATGVVSAPLSDMEPGYPAVIYNAPSISDPVSQQVPPRSLVSILRDGRMIDVTAGPPGLCLPGYVSAQQPGQAPRCTLVNPSRKQPGQRQVYFPSRGEGAFTK